VDQRPPIQKHKLRGQILSSTNSGIPVPARYSVLQCIAVCRGGRGPKTSKSARCRPCARTHTHTRAHIHTHLDVYCVCVRVCVSLCVCVCVCVGVCVNITNVASKLSRKKERKKERPFSCKYIYVENKF